MELSLLRLKKYQSVQYYSFQEKVLPKVMTFYFHIFLRFFVHFVILSQFTVRCVCVFVGGGGEGFNLGGHHELFFIYNLVSNLCMSFLAV